MSDVTTEQTNSKSSRGAEAADSLQKVAHAMSRLNVPGLPRNYELFHEALFGHDAGLTREIAALNAPPSQLLLDQIGLKYRLPSHCGVAEETVQRGAEGVLKSLTAQISAGMDHKKSFTRALETIVRSIREDESRGLRDLLEELDFLSSAATDLLVSENVLSQRLNDGLEQIQASAKAALAANAAMLRDRLTHLPNRIAFTNRLSALYEGDTNPRGTALILANINDFAAINADYGEDAANRILRRLAVIFRKTIKKNDFVARVGGDEFAFFFGDVTSDAARAIAERLHQAVMDNLIFATDSDGETTGLELALGVAITDDAMSPAQLLAQGEAALTAARRNRRTPVVVYATDKPAATSRRVA